MGLLTKFFGTHSEREVKMIMPLVDRINELRPAMQKLDDSQLRAKTDEFRRRYSEGETQIGRAHV